MTEAIGLFLRSADNAYQRQLKTVALREAKRYGFSLDVQSVQFDSGQQVAQIHDAIQKAQQTNLVAVLVSGVRDADLAPVAQEATEAGLDWALLNEGGFIDDLRKRHPERAVFSATSDQTEIGRLQAEQVRALIGEQGRALCVTGHLRNVASQLRLEGLKAGLASGFEIVEVNADWTAEGARRAMEAWANKLSPALVPAQDLPQVVVAQNDEMALGVRQALRDLDSRRDWGVANVPIVGCDGAEDFGQRLVREGRLKATVVMPAGSAAAIEWIARKRADNQLPPVRVVLPVSSFPALSRLR